MNYRRFTIRGDGKKDKPYKWDVDISSTISQATISKAVKRDKNELKLTIDLVKKIMLKEKDDHVKFELARAGLLLNRLYIR